MKSISKIYTFYFIGCKFLIKHVKYDSGTFPYQESWPPTGGFMVPKSNKKKKSASRIIPYQE